MGPPFFISMKEELNEEIPLLESVFREFERIGGVRIPRYYVGSRWGGGDFGNLDWYIQRSYSRERGQVRAPFLMNLCKIEPWKKTTPHFDLFVIEEDICAPNTNFLFGLTKHRIGSVISTYRLKRFYGSEWETAFYYITAHELGHLFGVPSPFNPNFIRENDPRAITPLDYGHCDNRYCVMEQINTEGRLDLLEKARLLQRSNSLFCEIDRRTLRRILRYMYNI